MVTDRIRAHCSVSILSFGTGALCLPMTRLFAQASPIQTGAESVVDELLALALPIAIIAVMVLGLMAFVGRLSWGVAVLCILGVCLVFGAPQLVDWGRSLFGV
jgi:type IV secretion system protein VirB2